MCARFMFKTTKTKTTLHIHTYVYSSYNKREVFVWIWNNRCGAAASLSSTLHTPHHTIKMKSTRAPSKVIRASWRCDMNKYALCNNIYVCIVCIVCVVCVCCRQTMPRVQWHNFYAQHWTLHGTASTLTCKSTISQAINLSCAFYGVFSIRRCSIYFYI